MMARRKRRGEHEHENLERWLVSYADFITLLFAFFVVMYSISAVNEGKYRVLSQALGEAFGRGVPVMVLPQQMPLPHSLRGGAAPTTAAPAVQTPAQPTPQQAAEAEAMKQVAKNLSSTLDPLVQQGVVRVSQTSKGVDIEINASLLFASGDATLSPDSRRALQAIAGVLKDKRYDLEVDGYTDDQPIKSKIYPSNWELSAVRAGSVARELGSDGIPDDRLKVVGYGSNQPLAPNDTPEGRARNRRVEVMVLAPQYEAARQTTFVTGKTK